MLCIRTMNRKKKTRETNFIDLHLLYSCFTSTCRWVIAFTWFWKTVWWLFLWRAQIYAHCVGISAEPIQNGACCNRFNREFINIFQRQIMVNIKRMDTSKANQCTKFRYIWIKWTNNFVSMHHTRSMLLHSLPRKSGLYRRNRCCLDDTKRSFKNKACRIILFYSIAMNGMAIACFSLLRFFDSFTEKLFKF